MSRVRLLLAPPPTAPGALRVKRLEGFSEYVWAKVVTGFNPNVHCARCLRGHYVGPDRGQPWYVGEELEVEVPEGAYLYVCGVSKGFVWANNFHLALRPRSGSLASKDTYNGFSFCAVGAEALEIPEPSEELRAQLAAEGKTKRHLTCRNYWFGLAAFGRGDA